MIGVFDFLMLKKARGAELEEVIDSAIRHAAAHASRTPITVATNGWPYDVIEAVLDKYKKVGWRAEVVPDSRDGDFIRLETP